MQFNEFAQKLSPNDIPKCLPITQTFQKYLNDASVYYSTKKTLLFAEKPCPFYDLYVCNKIRRNKLFISQPIIAFNYSIIYPININLKVRDGHQDGGIHRESIQYKTV